MNIDPRVFFKKNPHRKFFIHDIEGSAYEKQKRWPVRGRRPVCIYLNTRHGLIAFLGPAPHPDEIEDPWIERGTVILRLSHVQQVFKMSATFTEGFDAYTNMPDEQDAFTAASRRRPLHLLLDPLEYARGYAAYAEDPEVGPTHLLPALSRWDAAGRPVYAPDEKLIAEMTTRNTYESGPVVVPYSTTVIDVSRASPSLLMYGRSVQYCAIERVERDSGASLRFMFVLDDSTACSTESNDIVVDWDIFNKRAFDGVTAVAINTLYLLNRHTDALPTDTQEKVPGAHRGRAIRTVRLGADLFLPLIRRPHHPPTSTRDLTNLVADKTVRREYTKTVRCGPGNTGRKVIRIPEHPGVTVYRRPENVGIVREYRLHKDTHE